MGFVAIAAMLVSFTATAREQDAARQTHCQALARVIWGDLNGQKVSLDSFRTAHPTPSAAEQAIIDRKQAAYDADTPALRSLARQICRRRQAFR